jgi:hypothetical protein
MAAAVLVPVSQIIGFNKQLPAQYKLLPAPAASHRIVFAFSGNTTMPTPGSLFPIELAATILQWTVLASSGVHVASFKSRSAMQQAMVLLGNSTGLKYAVADFRLLQDSAVSTVIDPGQLYDLSRLPSRHLLQQQQHDSRNGSSGSAEGIHHSSSRSGSSYRVAQASKLLATHRQRLAQRKARRRQLLVQQPALASIELPATAQHLLEQQQLHWLDGEAEKEQQAVPAAGGQPLLRNRVVADVPASSLSIQQQQQQQSQQAVELPGSTICAGSGLQDNEVGDRSYSSSWASSYACGSGTTTAAAAKPSTGAAHAADKQPVEQHEQQRKLQQLPTPPAAATPQPQQTQAKQHVQKGGQGVAWHLTAAGLDAKQTWNKTYGGCCDSLATSPVLQ